MCVCVCVCSSPGGTSGAHTTAEEVLSQSTCEFLARLQEVALHWLRSPLSAFAFACVCVCVCAPDYTQLLNERACACTCVCTSRKIFWSVVLPCFDIT